jgi:ATP-dependent Lhr-like helicase
LGVDFAPVENHHSNWRSKVFARFCNAGRSDINLEREIIIYFLATHAMELVKPRHSKAAAETIVEDRIPYLNSYDVLIQYQIHWRFRMVFFLMSFIRKYKKTFCFQNLSV